MPENTTRTRWLTWDEAAFAVIVVSFVSLVIVATGCTESPAAPTPGAVAVEPSRSRGATESAPSSYLGDVGSIPTGISNIAPETLTLTVTPDGERDRVRASVGGIVGVSFYPGQGEKMPPNPLNGHGGQSITVRCDRTVSWTNGRPRVRTLPAGQRRRGDGVDIRVWVEHDGRRITHAGNAWATDGGSDYQVCAP